MKQNVVMSDEVTNQRRSNLCIYTVSYKSGKHQAGEFIVVGNFTFFIHTSLFTKFRIPQGDTKTSTTLFSERLY